MTLQESYEYVSENMNMIQIAADNGESDAKFILRAIDIVDTYGFDWFTASAFCTYTEKFRDSRDKGDTTP